jgi:hypothetical protein
MEKDERRPKILTHMRGELRELEGYRCEAVWRFLVDVLHKTPSKHLSPPTSLLLLPCFSPGRSLRSSPCLPPP